MIRRGGVPGWVWWTVTLSALAAAILVLLTLGDIASERSSTIVFPFPIDVAQTLRTFAEAASAREPGD